MTDSIAKALELLARRPHFRRELAQKLEARDYPSQEIAEALERLEELGYLDDRQCAEGLSRGPLSRKGYGPRRIRAELVRRGADEGLAQAVVDELFAAGEEQAAQRAARLWRQRGRGDRASLARHLDRKGFSKHVIVEILEGMAPSRGEGAEGP